jgi:predicted O-methyltransferase YrrM
VRSRIRKARAWARRTAFSATRALGYDLVARNVYTPVPVVDPGDDPWSRPASLVGVDIDLDAQLEFFDSALAPYLAEFTPRQTQAADGEFYLWNGYYQGVDAEVLYAMMRHLKPKRVLELGSGFSTLVTATACARNASEGRPCELIAVDPEPRVSPRVGGFARIDYRRTESLPLERYLELGPGDVLFVDTSHAVKLGSEVNFLVLEVLPRLRPGVIVHFHDIFLPFEYPREFFERGTYLSEQYLLHAFLIDNPSYTILLAVQALCREHAAHLTKAIPSLAADRENYPSAFWLVRRGGAGASYPS